MLPRKSDEKLTIKQREFTKKWFGFLSAKVTGVSPGFERLTNHWGRRFRNAPHISPRSFPITGIFKWILVVLVSLRQTRVQMRSSVFLLNLFCPCVFPSKNQRKKSRQHNQIQPEPTCCLRRYIIRKLKERQKRSKLINC